MTTIDELERFICWADLSIKEHNTTYYVVTGTHPPFYFIPFPQSSMYPICLLFFKIGYQTNFGPFEFIISKEYKVRSIPDHGFSFVSGGDMSMDVNGHKVINIFFHSFDLSFSFVLFCSVLFCFVLFCFVLFCFVLFCFVLFCFVLFCFVLFCFVLFCFVFMLCFSFLILYQLMEIAASSDPYFAMVGGDIGMSTLLTHKH